MEAIQQATRLNHKASRLRSPLSSLTFGQSLSASVITMIFIYIGLSSLFQKAGLRHTLLTQRLSRSGAAVCSATRPCTSRAGHEVQVAVAHRCNASRRKTARL